MSSGYRSLVHGGLLAAALSITAAPAPAVAAEGGTGTSHVVPGFPELSLNGTATVMPGHRIRLTNGGFSQTGSAWSTNQIDVTRSFQTTFRAFLHGPDLGADGVAFVVQAEGPRALGGRGGGLGYRGINPSVAVELDTFHNAPDPAGDHVGIVLRGNPDIHLATASPAKPLLGRRTTVRVAYNARAHTLRVDVDGTPALNQAVDVAGELGTGTAWIGFTGATGDLTSDQDILSWTVAAIAPRRSIG
jgi:hypothetical protein